MINISEGSCVTKGGTTSYKKKLKHLYILTKNTQIDMKTSIINIC